MSNIELLCDLKFLLRMSLHARNDILKFRILMDEFVSDYQSIGPNREIIELKVSISRFLKNRIF